MIENPKCGDRVKFAYYIEVRQLDNLGIPIECLNEGGFLVECVGDKNLYDLWWVWWDTGDCFRVSVNILVRAEETLENYKKLVAEKLLGGGPTETLMKQLGVYQLAFPEPMVPGTVAVYDKARVAFIRDGKGRWWETGTEQYRVWRDIKKYVKVVYVPSTED